MPATQVDSDIDDDERLPLPTSRRSWGGRVQCAGRPNRKSKCSSERVRHWGMILLRTQNLWGWLNRKRLRSSVRDTMPPCGGVFAVKTTFIKTIFIKKKVSSKSTSKPLSSKATFIKDHSHQKHFHQNHSHQKPLSSQIPLKGGKTKHAWVPKTI